MKEPSPAAQPAALVRLLYGVSMTEVPPYKSLCPRCGVTIYSYSDSSWYCVKCRATVDQRAGDDTFIARIEGEDASDVAQVLREVLTKMSRSPVSINISNSTIGILNTGEMEDIHSISLAVSTLAKSGETEIAESLKHITEALADSEDLSEQNRSEIIELLEELGTQAILSPQDRVNRSVIKALLSTIGSTLGAAGGLAEVWSTWGSAILAYFGL